MAFERATKEKQKLRLALVGPTGSGKTYTALKLAKTLADGGRIALIDSEKGSASLYAGSVADFDTDRLNTYEPLAYVKMINDAADAGYPVLIIDSLSHAWSGVGGALDQVDRRASTSLGKFGAWRDVSPMINELIDTILGYPGHIIVTMRAKMEYLIEEGKGGKKSITKVGLAPVQRAGLEYEFDVIGDMDVSHTMTISKSRCEALADTVNRKPGGEIAQALLDWLNDGEATPADQIYGAIVGGDIEQAKALTREHWKRLGRVDRERITTSIKAAEAPDDDDASASDDHPTDISDVTNTEVCEHTGEEAAE